MFNFYCTFLRSW